jgi:hypothetical protein
LCCYYLLWFFALCSFYLLWSFVFHCCYLLWSLTPCITIAWCGSLPFVAIFCCGLSPCTILACCGPLPCAIVVCCVLRLALLLFVVDFPHLALSFHTFFQIFTSLSLVVTICYGSSLFTLRCCYLFVKVMYFPPSCHV